MLVGCGAVLSGCASFSDLHIYKNICNSLSPTHEKKKNIYKKKYFCITVSVAAHFHSLQSEKDQAEMKELRETAAQQSKTIKRFNRGESTRRNTVRFIKQYMRKETFKQTYQAVI